MTVHMLDNSKKTFKIKSSARSADVAALMAQKLRLNQRLATTFMLFVSTSTTERSLQVRKKNKKTNSFLFYYYRKADDHPLDVLRGWGEGARLVYRKAVFRREDVQGLPASLSDPEHRRLLYIQAVADVLAGYYPGNDTLMLRLAALHTASQFGPAGEQNISLAALVDRYLPRACLKRRAAAQWEADILHAHRTLPAADASAPRLAYLATLRQRPYYGAQFFDSVEPINISGFPAQVLVGIDCFIVLIDFKLFFFYLNYSFISLN